MCHVLNVASKCRGSSLNKSLLVENLLPKLIFVILELRLHKYFVSANIVEIFLQVGVREEDQPSPRFLKRLSPISSVVAHQNTPHIIGARNLPTWMIFGLQKSASDHHAEYPEAATIVVYKFYMDDYPDSFQNSDEALKLSRDLVSLLELGGFKQNLSATCPV